MLRRGLSEQEWKLLYHRAEAEYKRRLRRQKREPKTEFLKELTPKQRKKRRYVIRLLNKLFSLCVSAITPEQERIEYAKEAHKLFETLLRRYSAEEILDVLTYEEKEMFLKRYEKYKRGEPPYEEIIILI